MFLFECVNCSTRTRNGALEGRCAKCKSALLLVQEASDYPSRSELEQLLPGVWRFRGFLPQVEPENVVSLGEGATPLLPARRLGDELGLRNLMIKDETRNPTGSFMDRGSTVLVSLARQNGIRRIWCATTGNLGASIAAYSAKAGIEAEVQIHPRTDLGKLYQMIAYGARVEVLSTRMMPERASDSWGVAVTAGNPFVLEGEKTTGFEIIQESGWQQPDAIVLPVGTGGHLTMVWHALQQLRGADLIHEVACKLVGVQIRASAPIVEGLHAEKDARGVEEALTELEESEPIFKKSAMKAIKDSGGHGVEISAIEAIHATSLLARTEGIFAEPASASVIASLKTMLDEGLLDAGDRIVCIITGAGLKDPKVIGRIAMTPKHIIAKEELVIRPLNVGITKLRIMGALAVQPRFGYELWKTVAKNGAITTASIYQHLSELEGGALIRRSRVTTARGRERIYYELTKKGVEVLRTVGRRSRGFIVD